MYLSWAAFYEGRTDASYFNVLIPRMLEEVLRVDGRRPYDVGLAPAVQFGIAERDFDKISNEICDRQQEFHIIFVHADGGSGAQLKEIASRREALIVMATEKCGFQHELFVPLTPVRELEAWALLDVSALKTALGISALPSSVPYPSSAKAAEALTDPKATLQAIINSVGRRRSNPHSVLVRIAQEQDLNRLRTAASFREFEKCLRQSLHHVGCLV